MAKKRKKAGEGSRPGEKVAGEWLQLEFHPRVFSALGSDLVTNDMVAITELVKNSYDAFADRVDVRFGTDERGDYLEVEDNGQGMDRDTIENAWCVVATPYRQLFPKSRKGKNTRRVSGEKGLGRLSAARLGDRLEMITKARNGTCWQVTADWPGIVEADDLSGCRVRIARYDKPVPFKAVGTRLRIYDLKTEWTDDTVEELGEQLARMVPPFEKVDDFSIFVKRPEADAEPAEIVPASFLKHPKYEFVGNVDDDGTLHWKYAFTPIGRKRVLRRASGSLSWQSMKGKGALKALSVPGCGPFRFEIRAWDVDVDSIEDISETYELKKGVVRKAITAHKGISVYRDGILALPKSDAARDWLGVDVRRISKVGVRMSTTQMLGYVAISAERNPKLKDTSDRERLVNQKPVHAFRHVLLQSMAVLENERQKDRLDNTRAERPMKDLFASVSGEELVESISEVAKAGSLATEAVPVVKEFSRELAKARDEIERRFVYYSRLATVGIIAESLLHEVKNQVTTLDSFIRGVTKFADSHRIPDKLREQLELADDAVSRLDQLADTFAPLANRSFRRGKRSCDLQDRVARILKMKAGDLERLGVEIINQPRTPIQVAIDPGELDAILLNLLDNALYWLEDSKVKSPKLAIRTSRSGSTLRVKIRMDDSGPGISEKDEKRVFWPGITNKPGGIGMGLTVASELVAAHGGDMVLEQPGRLGGATFAFDIPLKVKKRG